MHRLLFYRLLIFCLFAWCQIFTFAVSEINENNNEKTSTTATPINDSITPTDKPNSTHEKSPLLIDKTNPEGSKIIQAGDLVSITIKEDRDGPQTVLVDEQGMVTILYLGSIQAKGKTYTQLASDIQKALESQYYDRATVSVSPAAQEGTRGRIYVLGQVNNPGPVKIPTDEILTTSRAILQAGITTNADLTRVSIVRKDPKNANKDLKMDINISEVINNGRFDLDVIVRANDMIFVPSKGESVGQVLMSGAIRQPGPLEIPIGGKFMVTDAIFRAGGFADFADKAKVKIVRKDPIDDKKQETIIVNIEAIMEKGRRELDQPLQDQDVVIVPERWFNF
jgi:protein involved in polysaccharide export with SLBB domain